LTCTGGEHDQDDQPSGCREELKYLKYPKYSENTLKYPKYPKIPKLTQKTLIYPKIS